MTPKSGTYYAKHRDAILSRAKAKREGEFWEGYQEISQIISERRAKNRAAILEYLGGKCVECGYNAHPSALEIDHIDPSTKTMNLTGKMPLKVIPAAVWKELEGCQLLCCNCHRVKSVQNKEIGRKRKHPQHYR